MPGPVSVKSCVFVYCNTFDVLCFNLINTCVLGGLR